MCQLIESQKQMSECLEVLRDQIQFQERAREIVLRDSEILEELRNS